MTWEEVRQQYPNRWLVFEATASHDEGGRRVLDDIRVLDEFDQDSRAAWDFYKSQFDGERELYVLHTSRESLDIRLMDARGRYLG